MMNGSPNLGTADKSSSGLNAAIIRAGAMAAMDMVAVAMAAMAVAVAAVAAVEAGIIMEAVEAKAKIMSGVLMRPQWVTVPRHLRKVQIPSTVSTASQSQASTRVGNDCGGQNGNRFGSNRP